MCSGSGKIQSTEGTVSAPMSLADYTEGIPLDKMVKTPIEIANIAEKIKKWERIAQQLGLSDPQVEAIKNDYRHYEEQKLAMIPVQTFSISQHVYITLYIQVSEKLVHIF